jgi:acetyl-CoA carboxylase biotin carboxyl carrier protein
MMAEVKAQMAGTVFEVSVKEGDHVSKGQTLIILESMKMEIVHDAESDGTVVKVRVTEGDFVEENDVLVELG